MWRTVKLGDICSVITKGTTPTSVGFKFQDEGINFVKIESIDESGNFIKSKFAKIGEDCHASLKRSQLAEGDILFSIAGALGRTAVVTPDILPANTNQALAILRIKSELEIDKRYMLYVLNSETTKSQSEANKGGVAQLNLSLSQLKDYSIQLPPLTEQQRIVAKLDAAFAEIDNAIKLVGTKQANAEKLKASLLDASLKGDDAMWNTVKLGDALSIARGGSPRPIKSFITDADDGVNWIKIGDTSQGGRYIESTKEKIKPSGISRSRYVKTGDFLLSNSMSFGRPYILKTDGCIHDGWLVLSDYEQIFTADYLYYLLSSSVVQNQFEKLARGSTVRNLNTELVSSVVVSVPQLAEQHRIVAKLDAAFTEVDTVFAKTTLAKANYITLKSVILAQELQPREAA